METDGNKGKRESEIIEENLRIAEEKIYELYVKDGENVDITEIYDELVRKNAEVVINHVDDDFVSKNIWWVKMVNTGKPWDLKNRKINDVFIWSHPYKYEGEIMRSDDFGNMHYGAMGALIFSDEYSKLGAGGAQFLSNTMRIIHSDKTVIDKYYDFRNEVIRYGGSIGSGGYGDHSGDADSIQRGIDEFWEKNKDLYKR